MKNRARVKCESRGKGAEGRGPSLLVHPSLGLQAIMDKLLTSARRSNASKEDCGLNQRNENRFDCVKNTFLTKVNKQGDKCLLT